MRKLSERLYVIVPLLLVALPMFADGIKFEAENARYSNCTVVTDTKYSGGKALRMTESTAKATFTLNVEERGKYAVYVGGEGIGGEKDVNCTVNGNRSSFKLNLYGEVKVGTFIMDKGDNTIAITPSWTWFNIDYVRIEANTDVVEFDISASPVDADATDAARAMYEFLLQNFGTKTISGIMTGDMSSDKGDITQHDDMRAVHDLSGKFPALVGFDFMNATGKLAADSWAQNYTRSCINLAKDTYRRGGLPAFTWHWRDPSRSTDAFYTSDTNMRITSAMNGDGSWNEASPLYKNLIKDIDTVADYLLELQAEGMACIFRPLHEASGGWFWWGREGAAPFRKLYQLIFDEMVRVKGVHNVIWVWNAGADDKDWNPGDERYDVVSADIYNNDYDYSSNYVTFDNLKILTGGKKLIALSENGPIPDIDREVEDEAVWSWWMPWYNTWGGNFVKKTSREEWTKCMNDSRVITLEDLSAGWGATAIVSMEQHETPHGIFSLNGHRLPAAPTRGAYITEGKVFVK
ncbi:MAG: hypothetical protein J1E77_09730 [Prevotella sp.]|nr:hypothetical protein [Prevotella sp.]